MFVKGMVSGMRSFSLFYTEHGSGLAFCCNASDVFSAVCFADRCF